MTTQTAFGGRATRRAPRATWLTLLAALWLAGCSSMPQLDPVENVDLERFMGDWYVIAHIPTFLETEAFNAIEAYALDDDGTVATTFTFREGAFDGEEKRYNPRGFPDAKTNNAVWGMRFVWPIKADYRVVYLDEAYTVTIIGRNKRDYVWLMAREPDMTDERYAEFVALIGEMGYETDKLRRVPQRWSDS